MSALNLRAMSTGCVLQVRVQPGARENAILGAQEGALKVGLTTPPNDGRANAALVKLLAVSLGVDAGTLKVISGAAAGRMKAVAITGLTAAELRERLPASVPRD